MIDILLDALRLLVLAAMWYFAYTRFKVGLKWYGRAMVGAATVAAIFKSFDGGLGYAGVLISVLYWALYCKSLLVMREHGLDDGFF